MQLDFLSSYENKLPLTTDSDPQYNFWDKDYKIVRVERKAKYTEVEKFFRELDYSKVPVYRDYWEDISPENDSQLFQRWLFSFMSVHTSWKANVTGYNAIKDWWGWLNRWEELHKAIDDSRVGMQNNRLKYLKEFAHKFWKNPSEYRKGKNESWMDLRDRLKKTTLGLGPAKTSFALEMCYPTEAKVVCLDTHMFQAYGLDQVEDSKKYKDIETHWVDMCNMWNVPPYIARCLYWDTKQNKTTSRYWSYVFEKNQ